jgi:two-component system, response regulator PdtaR
MIATNDASQKLILVVEDDALLRESLSLMLQDLGYQVVDAKNADDAIGLAVKSARPIDLVFTDVDMPGTLDGIGLAEWFAHSAPHVPVLLTSGKISAAPTDHCFLAKPVDNDELRCRIDELLSSRSLAARPA